jgi:hypothetical protein
MQKYKFSVTCPGMLFIETAPSMKNSALMFRATEATNCTK